jgi:hypothetical protein
MNDTKPKVSVAMTDVGLAYWLCVHVPPGADKDGRHMTLGPMKGPAGETVTFDWLLVDGIDGPFDV